MDAMAALAEVMLESAPESTADRTAVSRALQASLRANNDRIQVAFVPLGLIVNGKPAKPEVKAPVRIGKASLFVEKATEGK